MRGRRLATGLVVIMLGSFATSTAQATVSKSQRNAVVFVSDLSTGFSGFEVNFYQAVEKAAYLGAVTILGPFYNHVFQVEGANATLVTLRNALIAATSSSSTTAVDLIFVTHGMDRNVVFAGNTSTPITAVRDDLISHLSPAARQKLRIVFSTACFGATHRTGWLQSGFKAASGAVGVYSDSASSYVPFLTAWALGQSFGSAVTIANLADPFHIQDSIANNTVLANTPFQGQANSTRVISGNAGLTIDGNPVGTFDVSPASGRARPGTAITYRFGWTVPKPRRWQSLHDVDLRLRDAKGTAIALGWTRASNAVTLVNASFQPIGAPGHAGRRAVLRGPLARLDLRGTTIRTGGRKVTLTLPVTLLSKAAGRTFRVEVAARDNSGRATPWNVAGVLSVTR